MMSPENIERYEKILESSGTVMIALDEFSNEFIKIFLRSDGDYDITHWKDCVGQNNARRTRNLCDTFILC